MINTENMEWKTIRASGEYIFPRKNHTSCIVGKFLVVHGGIDNREWYLRDLWILDIRKNYKKKIYSFFTILKHTIHYFVLYFRKLFYHKIKSSYRYKKKYHYFYFLLANQRWQSAMVDD